MFSRGNFRYSPYGKKIITLLNEGNSLFFKARELAVVNNCHPHRDCFSSLGTGWSALFLDRGTQPILDTAKATSTNCKMDLTDSKHMMYQSASTHLPIELLSACLATLMMIQVRNITCDMHTVIIIVNLKDSELNFFT